MRPLSFIIMLTAALVTLAIIAAVLFWLGLAPFGAERTRAVFATIAGNTLRVDPNYLRLSDQKNGGDLDHIDLAARYPDFLPARLPTSARSAADADELRQIVIGLPP